MTHILNDIGQTLRRIEQLLSAWTDFFRAGQQPMFKALDKGSLLSGREGWLDPRQVQDYLQISKSTLRRLKLSGILVAHKIGGRDYYLQQELALAFSVSIQRGRI